MSIVWIYRQIIQFRACGGKEGKGKGNGGGGKTGGHNVTARREKNK